MPALRAWNTAIPAIPHNPGSRHDPGSRPGLSRCRPYGPGIRPYRRYPTTRARAMTRARARAYQDAGPTGLEYGHTGDTPQPGLAPRPGLAPGPIKMSAL